MDMTESIAPRSDQLNAEDLLTGPRTFTIEKVAPGNTEQPVHVHLVEFPGRPFKPSKTVRRLMVAAWGPDTVTYTGKRMTLYRDPTVRFGGQDVGGIRVSHMSGLEKRLTLALTVTRGKRAPYTVEPLPDVAPQQAPADTRPDPRLVDRMVAGFDRAGITDKAARLDYCRNLIGRDIASAGELTGPEVGRVVTALEADVQAAQ